MPVKTLTPDMLFNACKPEQLDFSTTDDLSDPTEPIGQTRAMQAIEFGVDIRYDGYNLFLLGSTGIGKHEIAMRELQTRAESSAVPSDWCYVNNFDEPHHPKVLELPNGIARQLRDDMMQLVEDLQNAIPATFRSDEYRTRLMEINEEFSERQETAFEALDADAAKRGLRILRTPSGYTIAPMRDGSTMGPAEFDKLPKEEQDGITAAIKSLREELKETVRKLPMWQKEYRQRIKELNREVTELTVAQLIENLISRYRNQTNVLEFIQTVKGDIIDNADAFLDGEEDAEFDIEQSKPSKRKNSADYAAYNVNILVDNSRTEGAPVIYEDNPNYNNLLGRVEHVSKFGTLLTNFTLIKSGALHRANGGYLVLEARKVLMNPLAWEGLKRVLRARELRITSIEQMLSLVSTISLEPEPIPINIKIVLLGDRLLYYLLLEYDPEFSRLFKVVADFEEDVERNPENTLLYAKLIASLQRREYLRAFDRDGVASVIEQCARRAEDGLRMSLHMGSLVDLLREADYWADRDGSRFVCRRHVHKALDQQRHRRDQYRERALEAVVRGTRVISTSGSAIGQVNGLSVFQISDYSFGQPARITATARMGEAGVIDIEREVDMGGPIHSKAVMILSAYLADRFSADEIFSLSASVVFEQSYHYVEGDSATVAELCALLSAITKIPIKQSLAITGSMDQLGVVQAIGGVNEKIEGFFDLCQVRGLTGEQGVVIPQANVQHLMLRADVVEAAHAGRFHIHAVDGVDDAITLLFGVPAGAENAHGEFDEGSVNAEVLRRFSYWRQLKLEDKEKETEKGKIEGKVKRKRPKRESDNG